MAFWQSLENIRERLAVLETEVRHSRRDLLRLETSLHSHVADHRRCPPGNGGNPDGGQRRRHQHPHQSQSPGQRRSHRWRPAGGDSGPGKNAGVVVGGSPRSLPLSSERPNPNNIPLPCPLAFHRLS